MAVSGASVRSRWSRPGSGAWAPWSPLPAVHSRGLTHELTLAACLPAGLAPHSPGQPGPRLLPALSCPLFSRFLFTLWVKLSRPKHEESVPAHPACLPRPVGSEDVVAAPAGPVLCVGAGRAELVLGCTALPPASTWRAAPLVERLCWPLACPVALMARGQCSELALADTLVTGGVWRVLVSCMWPATGLRLQQTVVLVFGVFFPNQGCLCISAFRSLPTLLSGSESGRFLSSSDAVSFPTFHIAL